MPDLVLVLCFFSMLFVPCVVAFHNARIGQEVTASEPSEAGVGSSLRKSATFPTLTRAELTAKRNRELYLRSVGELQGSSRHQELAG